MYNKSHLRKICWGNARLLATTYVSGNCDHRWLTNKSQELQTSLAWPRRKECMIWRIFNVFDSKTHLHNTQIFSHCLSKNKMRLDYTDLQYKAV